MSQTESQLSDRCGAIAKASHSQRVRAGTVPCPARGALDTVWSTEEVGSEPGAAAQSGGAVCFSEDARGAGLHSPCGGEPLCFSCTSMYVPGWLSDLFAQVTCGL